MSLISDITAWYSTHMTYTSVAGLMAVESSFIPFPSEVVVPPAAYVVGVDSSSALCVSELYWVNVALIVAVASLGAIIGACINYGLSIWLGRPIIYKFADSKLGHMLLLSSEKIQRAEEYFNEHGKVSTFVGRLIPGIRQLISIPAGLANMSFKRFTFFTGLGAGIYSTPEEATKGWQKDLEFTPRMDDATRLLNLRGWHKAVERSLAWAKD